MPYAGLRYQHGKVVIKISHIKSIIENRIEVITPAAVLIILFTIGIFLPVIFSAAALIAVVAYFFINREIRSKFIKLPLWPLTIALMALMLIVPSVYGNFLGLGCGAVICMIIIASVFMRICMTKKLYEFVLDVACISSLLGVLVSYIEKAVAYFALSDASHRPFSIYINANYFATICVFVMLICIYKLITSKQSRIFYIAVFLLNGLSLYLTNCRSAFIPLFVGLLIMLLINGRRKAFFISLGVVIALIIAAFTVSGLFPRLEDLGGRTYHVRKVIWDTAIQAIADRPLFGRGPLSFLFVYEQYGAALQLHAHNIALEFLMSFGVIGTALLVIYFVGGMKDVIGDARRQKTGWAGASIVIAVIAGVLIHGITDCTLIGPQTPLLFVLLMSYPSSRFNYEAAASAKNVKE